MLASGLRLFKHHVRHRRHRHHSLGKNSDEKLSAGTLSFERAALLSDLHMSDDSRTAFLDAGPFGEGSIGMSE